MADKKKTADNSTAADEEKDKETPAPGTDENAPTDDEDDDEEASSSETDDEKDQYADARKAVKTVKQLAAAFPELVTAVRSAERKRVTGIIDITPAGQEALARECIDEGASVGAAAAKLLKGSGDTAQARLNAFTKPSFTPPSPEKPDDANAAARMAKEILDAGRVARGEKVGTN